MKTRTLPSIHELVSTRLPNCYGSFVIHCYGSTADDKQHLALVKGDVAGHADVLVRVHSECLTGDVFGSTRCDCGEQLELALRAIGQAERGVLLYLRQEGRGIGLVQKLRAYNLQDEGLDTVEANLQLGHQADERDYHVAARILKDLGVRSVRLMTNNPRKLDDLLRYGIPVSARVPIQAPSHPENVRYLRAKVEKMAHLLSLEGGTRLPQDFDFLEPLFASLAAAHSQPTGRPFVTLAYTQSLDGVIAEEGNRDDLSAAESGELVRTLRAHHDALLVDVDFWVGAGELRSGPPSWCEDVGQLVVLDSHLRFPWQSYQLGRNLPPFVITTEMIPQPELLALEARRVPVLTVAAEADGEAGLAATLDRLSRLGLRTLLVQGSADFVSRFLRSGLTDYGVITVAPHWLGSALVGRGIAGAGPSSPHPVTLANCRYHTFGRNLIVHGPLEIEQSGSTPG
jgi:3,4-dihydroxy 2-butanone 4-phosphate synthase/GTP cyclohydrolase II